MRQIRLSKRLSAIAAHIPPGGVADVGTDHGYIPVGLALSAYDGRIAASDIKPGPLDAARQTAIRYGVCDKIDFCLCDGLSGISPDGISAVVIAGMGGESIADILTAAPWTADGGRTIIMQPMTKSDILRAWLLKNGYRVLTEELCENGPLYEIITATGGDDLPCSPAEMLIGRISLISSDPHYRQRLSELTEKSKKAIIGLEASSRAEDKERLKMEKAILSELNGL